MNHDEVMVAAIVSGISLGFITTPLLAMAKDAFLRVLSWLVSLVVVTHEMEDYLLLTKYLNQHGKSLVSNREVFEIRIPYVTKLKRNVHMFFRRSHEAQRLSRYKGALIWFRPRVMDRDRAVVSKATVSYLRWTVNWEELLTAAALFNDRNNQKSNPKRWRTHPCIERLFGSAGSQPQANEIEGLAPSVGPDYDDREPVGWSVDELGDPQPASTGIDAISLCPATEAVVQDITRWSDSKEWYQERGVPWRRGYLLHGQPGTGKTSFVRAISEELGLNVISIDLASCTNHDLYEFWRRAARSAPCILLLEDIDSVFHGRENVVPDGELTFDALLNSIDGLEKSDGIALFVTTNHLEHIDPALGVAGPGCSTRPGRIDMIAELPTLNLAGRLKIANRILKDSELAEKMAQEHQSVTGAQFQEICCQLALKLYWNAKDGK